MHGRGPGATRLARSARQQQHSSAAPDCEMTPDKFIHTCQLNCNNVVHFCKGFVCFRVISRPIAHGRTREGSSVEMIVEDADDEPSAC